MVPAVLDLPHLDLLLIARQLWRDHLASRAAWVSLDKRSAGRSSSRTGPRVGTDPDALPAVPRVRGSVRYGQIFYHNEVDVLSLVSLLIHHGPDDREA